MAIDNTAFIQALANTPDDTLVVVKTSTGRVRRYGSPVTARRYLAANTYQATGVEGINTAATQAAAAAPAAPANDLDPVAQGEHQRQAMAYLATEMGQTLDDEMTALVEADQEVGMVAVLAFIQDTRKALGALEDRIQHYAGQAWLDKVGRLPDGREYEIKRKTDRKAWKHDKWKHDARAAVVAEFIPEDSAAAAMIDGDTQPLGRFLQEAMTKLQTFHGAAAPKVTALRQFDLDPEDYCETVRGGYGVRIIDPSADAE